MRTVLIILVALVLSHAGAAQTQLTLDSPAIDGSASAIGR